MKEKTNTEILLEVLDKMTKEEDKDSNQNTSSTKNNNIK